MSDLAYWALFEQEDPTDYGDLYRFDPDVVDPPLPQAIRDALDAVQRSRSG